MADDGLQARLRQLFHAELVDGLVSLEGAVRQLAAAGSSDDVSAVVAEAFRVAHGLKGAAHSVGLLDAVETCDELETLFAAARTDPSQVVSDAAVGIADILSVLRATERRLAAELAPRSRRARPVSRRPTSGCRRSR